MPTPKEDSENGKETKGHQKLASFPYSIYLYTPNPPKRCKKKQWELLCFTGVIKQAHQ